MAITSGNNTDPKDLDALKQLFAGGGASAASAGQVYMGTTFNSGKNVNVDKPRRKVPNFVTTDQALAEFYTWSDKKRKDFTAKAIVGGLLQPGDGPVEAGKVWSGLVSEAANYGAAGQQVSPFDLLTSYVKSAGGAQKDSWQSLGAFQVNSVTGEKRYAGPGIYLGNGVAQQTDTRVDLTDPDTAKAIATQLFQQLMGRDPGQGELGAFGSALSAAESANPVTQTTTTDYNLDTGQPVSTNTQSSGGVDAQGQQYIGEQQIKGTKEYGALQAATTYANAFDDAIFGGP